MLFLDFIYTVHEYCMVNEKTLGLWIDIFCVSQQGRTQWFLKTFLEAVKGMGLVLMVLLQWQNPIPITSTWCVFEVFVCVATKAAFNVCFPAMPVEHYTFLDAIIHDLKLTMQRMVARLQTEES